MKIILTGPNTRNDGSYVDAGAEVEVGDQPDQINADRAKALADGYGLAERSTASARAELVANAEAASGQAGA